MKLHSITSNIFVQTNPIFFILISILISGQLVNEHSLFLSLDKNICVLMHNFLKLKWPVM